MKIHERLLNAYSSHDVPEREMLELIHPLTSAKGEERTLLQDKLADYIEQNYPYRPGKEPKEEE